MQHEEHSPLPVKGFGQNTNGLGILVVTIVAVCLTVFCWTFWKDGSRETELYRFQTTAGSTTGEGHGETGTATEAPAPEAASAAAVKADSTEQKTDTTAKAMVDTDSSKTTKPDSTKK